MILSEYSVRAQSLTDMIRSIVNVESNILTVHPADLKSYNRKDCNFIIFIDLMGCQKPPHQIISTRKSKMSDAKIIALHIYRNKSLIKPIINAGVDGYLFYEPSRLELAMALTTVQTGNTYTSAYIDA